MVKKKTKEREIYLKGKITPNSFVAVAKALKKLDAKSHEPILFFINSKGGSIFSSVDIHHALRNSKSEIKTIGFGMVRSAALMVLQGGDKRFVKPNCKLKFHQASLKLGSHVNGHDLNLLSRELLQADAIQIYILTSRGSPSSKIVDLLKQEAVIDSKKALKLKIIDGIWKRPISRPR